MSSRGRRARRPPGLGSTPAEAWPAFLRSQGRCEACPSNPFGRAAREGWVQAYEAILVRDTILSPTQQLVRGPKSGKEKGPSLSRRAFSIYSRRRPTLPHSLPCSTIGAGG